MQNLFSNLKIFVDAGYFSCAYGFIFIYWLLSLLVSLSFSHSDFCFI